MVHPAELDRPLLLQQCDVRRQRRSGPGGQHRNKVETGIFLLHRPTGVEVAATERRRQTENLGMAVRRLRLELALTVRETQRVPGGSLVWKRHHLAGQIRISKTNDDFPSLLAEVLDVLAISAWDLKDAAKWLGCTRSQIVAFLGRSPRGLEILNRQRVAMGLKKLQP